MELGKSVKYLIRDSVRYSIWPSVDDLVDSYVWYSIRIPIWDSVNRSVRDLSRLK